MAEKQQCRLFLLRYVPDAVKSEFVNIGLVLLPSGGVPELRFTRDWARARCMDPDADIELLSSLEAELRERLRVNNGGPEDALRQIQESFSNALQVSESKACVAESPAAEADELARIYLERARRGAAREASPRHQILQRMRDEFDKTGVLALMSRNIPVAQYTRAGDPLRIDYGYATGASIRMFQALPLQGEANTAKALAFSYPRLAEGIRRDEGAHPELTAIVEDALDRDNKQVEFALEILRQQAIRISIMSDLPRIALEAARDLGVSR